jgi:hypothetical protein
MRKIRAFALGDASIAQVSTAHLHTQAAGVARRLFERIGAAPGDQG